MPRDWEHKRQYDRDRMRRLYYEPRNNPEPEHEPRVLIVDIETMANLVWEWDVKPRAYYLDPKMIVQHKRTISFAAKWLGERKVLYFSEFHHDRETMVQAAWDLLDQADAVVGYNSKRFDIKHLQTEFLLEGLGPPSHFQQIDLLQVVRREFLFGSNKLEAVADRVGIGHKLEHEGMALWLKVEAGDRKAANRMRSYNRQDVKLTERLFNVLRPWVPLRGTQSQKRLRTVLEASA